MLSYEYIEIWGVWGGFLSLSLYTHCNTATHCCNTREYIHVSIRVYNNTQRWCSSLYAPYCTALHHTHSCWEVYATHCNTLQHTATQYVYNTYKSWIWFDEQREIFIWVWRDFHMSIYRLSYENIEIWGDWKGFQTIYITPFPDCLYTHKIRSKKYTHHISI